MARKKSSQPEVQSTEQQPKSRTKRRSVGDQAALPTTNEVDEIAASDLSDRDVAGLKLWERLQEHSHLAILINQETTGWFSSRDATRIYQVQRAARNTRNKVVTEYRCTCPDFVKHGANGCKHIFAEQLRRGEVSILGQVSPQRRAVVKAQRQPARKRQSADGRPIRSAQRAARVAMPNRILELTRSLKQKYDSDNKKARVPRRGGKLTSDSTRAFVLASKVAAGRSADTMVSEYDRMIENGILRLRKAPHQNTLTDWINDEALTPVLEEFLLLTTQPFRRREVGAIIDSTKVSQLMTAHYRLCEYGNDVRETAEWIKCHALVGIETLVVMAVDFSGTLGEGTHDIKFVQSLVTKAMKTFSLTWFLGDKAYLSEGTLGWLWDLGIKAVIPIKKRWDLSTKSVHYEAAEHLAVLHNDSPQLFHEIYRFRTKIEGLFSLLKRMAQGHCWSRGRRPTGQNPAILSTAWHNELLCKFIYMNLRTTVTLEEETGYKIDYLNPNRFFPEPVKRVLAA
jgi:hypothetical protein